MTQVYLHQPHGTPASAWPSLGHCGHVVSDPVNGGSVSVSQMNKYIFKKKKSEPPLYSCKWNQSPIALNPPPFFCCCSC